MARIRIAVKRAQGRTAAGAAVCALAAAGVLAGCGASTTGATQKSSNPTTIDLARAAYITNGTPGLRFSLLVTAHLAGQAETITGSGSLQTRGQRGSLDLSVAGRHVNEIISYPYIYVEAQGAVPATAGKRWIRVNAAALTGTQGLSGGSGADPTQTLAYLRAAASVRRLGSASVRGVRTTEYHAVVNLHSLAAQATTASLRKVASHQATLLKEITGSDTLPMDVYLDAQGRARRITVFESICTQAGHLDESVSMDFYDFVAQPVVKVPAASQVTDETAKLSAAVQQSAATLRCGTKVTPAAPK